MTHRFPILEVESFGPIARAEVELRPLTVLIGPNNSGKSYIGKLAYLFSIATTDWGEPRSTGQNPLLAQVLNWERSIPRKLTSELPNYQQELYHRAIGIAVEQRKTWLRSAMSNHFGADLDQLVNRHQRGRRAHIGFRQETNYQGSLGISLVVQDHEYADVFVLPEIDDAIVPDLAAIFTSNQQVSDDELFQVGHWALGATLRLSDLGEGGVFFLPGGRSGLLASAQLIGAAAISLVAQRAGLAPIELGVLAGVDGDFVRAQLQAIPVDTNLLEREGWTIELEAALRLLEELMEGLVLVVRSAIGRPTVIYRPKGLDLDLPMDRSSSMVSELAAVALWVKAFLRRGDTLIIDEPEAHLHPENQRRIARVLVRLVNAGVRVICTTHSSLILHQLSNCILAGQLSAEDRRIDDLVDADTLDRTDLGVYVFQPTKKGTVVSPVEIDETYGIDEEEFVRVAQSIGQESYLLAVRAERARALAHA